MIKLFNTVYNRVYIYTYNRMHIYIYYTIRVYIYIYTICISYIYIILYIYVLTGRETTKIRTGNWKMKGTSNKNRNPREIEALKTHRKENKGQETQKHPLTQKTCSVGAQSNGCVNDLPPKVMFLCEILLR